jgi:hypothetical protein
MSNLLYIIFGCQVNAKRRMKNKKARPDQKLNDAQDGK